MPRTKFAAFRLGAQGAADLAAAGAAGRDPLAPAVRQGCQADLARDGLRHLDDGREVEVFNRRPDRAVGAGADSASLRGGYNSSSCRTFPLAESRPRTTSARKGYFRHGLEPARRARLGRTVLAHLYWSDLCELSTFAVEMSARCENPCGKFPICRRWAGSYSSARSPRGLRSDKSRSNSSSAS